jgi:lipoprotein-anchoring transpeptidase ErfK/SrfK
MRRRARAGQWAGVWLVSLALLFAFPSAALAAGPGDGHPAPLGGSNRDVIEPERHIEVDLSEQRLTAWEGTMRVRVLMVSTGDDEHPTIRGEFVIKAKYESIDMIGRDYYYRAVPYVMMFSRPFYIHAAPWRTRFGVPLSRGCVTLSTRDAEWLFRWAPLGTVVDVHY